MKKRKVSQPTFNPATCTNVNFEVCEQCTVRHVCNHVCNKLAMDNFATLQRRVKALNGLLADPQPGLVSWCMIYADHMKWISNYWVTG